MCPWTQHTCAGPQEGDGPAPEAICGHMVDRARRTHHSTPSAKDGGRGPFPASQSFWCFWGRITDPAAPGESGGWKLAAWPREAGTKESAQETGQSQPRTVWL